VCVLSQEVVVWSIYFGDEVTAKKTVDHVLSYNSVLAGLKVPCSY